MTVIFSGQRRRRPGLVQIRKGKSAPAKRTYTPHLGNKKAKKFIRWSTIFQSRRPEINFTTCACRIVLERQSRQWTRLLPINYSNIIPSFVEHCPSSFFTETFLPLEEFLHLILVDCCILSKNIWRTNSQGPVSVVWPDDHFDFCWEYKIVERLLSFNHRRHAALLVWSWKESHPTKCVFSLSNIF